MTANGTPERRSDEWARVSAASSAVAVMARYVIGLHQLSPIELPAWLTALELPVGWRTGRFENAPSQPWRIAVYGPHVEGGFDGCETVAVFGFHGALPLRVLMESADCAFRDLDADQIETNRLSVSSGDHVEAVRSTGYFAAGGLWIWGQHSYFLADSPSSGTGVLIHQSIFVESSRRSALCSDVAALSDQILNSFVAESVSGP
jgi:hypothetical protein